MITILRKLRQKLLSENKFTKYLLYAIGEIVLVVIGILIALQINTWNENQKFLKEKQRVIRELNNEFLTNRMVLKERINALEHANQNVTLILNSTGNNFNSNINWDSIIDASLTYGNYNPTNNTINELLNSGELSKVANEALKAEIHKWMGLLDDAEEDFKNQDQQATLELTPYLSGTISIKNLNYYVGIQGEKSELFDYDYKPFFDDLRFENIFQSKLFWNSIMLQHYEELDAIAEKIVNLTEKSHD